MLGLRPDTGNLRNFTICLYLIYSFSLLDSTASSMYRMVGGNNPVSNTTGGKNGRSYRFAGKLSGRFFVSGISGGFDKHKQQQLKQDVMVSSKVISNFSFLST